MYLIAGLGNPGSRYEMTRHNIGFHAIDYIADTLGVKIKKLKFKALYADTEINGERVLLVKPQTFMNLSGESIVEFVRFFKIPIENVIIISDEISLPTGTLRIRKKGSAGGHNGLKSIIYLLNSDEFPRIRIGVGAPQNKDYDLADYVLGRFSHDEIPILEDTIKRTCSAVGEFIKNGADSAMNIYNHK
jgi:PTH1 family peptidyl-tRNA hydrolase